MSPQRIQLSRRRGYRKPEGAVVVARPSKWGNPVSLRFVAEREAEGNPTLPPIDQRAARAFAVEWYRAWIDMAEAADLIAALPDLRGRDLACWCPLDQPCHADVLLEIANAPSDPFPLVEVETP